MTNPKILWVDDEIERLQPHIIFLNQKGYEVTPASNGFDAIHLVKQENFDIVLLDEMMPGMDGLTVLANIKEISPGLPIVMITKSEEETLMEEAIGKKIADYLTKPVNPSQILLACKKILEGKKLEKQMFNKDYRAEFGKIAMSLMEPLNSNDWTELYDKITELELETDNHPELNLHETLSNQKIECNVEFGKFIEKNYLDWINHTEGRPLLSVDVVRNWIKPLLAGGEKVVFVVVDCLRYDQWLMMENELKNYFKITTDFHYSILPTATPYSRNAIFSGLFPIEIERRFPELWQTGDDDDTSRNRYEKELLELQLQRLRLAEKIMRFDKIINTDDSKRLEKNILSYVQANDLTAIVFNFVDILAHSRADSRVLKELAPTEAAYRSLTGSWFKHSPLFEVFRLLSKQKVKIVLTTDHGSIRVLHETRVHGDKDTSTSLRYKYGRSLNANLKDAIYVDKPESWKLPRRGLNTTYIIAKEDYYFIYPTNFHKFKSYYYDSFQHGGISMEEMILPVVTLESKV
ncbi:PglZ domain-containing protein [bacterium]|nr:PglZ domain-containing protein [bacterium]